jgi:hypothetical protein
LKGVWGIQGLLFVFLEGFVILFKGLTKRLIYIWRELRIDGKSWILMVSHWRCLFFRGFFVLWISVPLLMSFFCYPVFIFMNVIFLKKFQLSFPLIMNFFSYLKLFVPFLLWGFIFIFRSIYFWNLFIFLKYGCFWGISIFWGLFVHIWKELKICESSLWKPIWNYGSHGGVAYNITNLTNKNKNHFNSY